MDIFRKNALDKGKKVEYEYIKLDQHSVIWVCDIKVMNAIWNTLLYLQKQKVILLPYDDASI